MNNLNNPVSFSECLWNICAKPEPTEEMSKPGLLPSPGVILWERKAKAVTIGK